jgi:hypothetical protein
MARKIFLDHEVYLKEMRRHVSASDWNPDKERPIVELVDDLLERYVLNWPETSAVEQARLIRLIDHLNASLSVILPETYPFSSYDDQPFEDEKSCLAWLRGDQPHEVSPEGLVPSVRDWQVHNLWNVLVDAEAQLSSLYSVDKAWDDHWAPLPDTASRVPRPVLALIHGLCVIWHSQVDSRLSPATKNPNPDNPLLRFLDKILEAAMGERRPSKTTVNLQVYNNIGPAIRREAARREVESLHHDDASPMDIEAPFSDVEVHPHGLRAIK